MKFGGTSLASAASLQQVVAIVDSQLHRSPVIVASAIGDTTDHLLELVLEARRAHTHAALRVQDEIRSAHFALCDELLHGGHRECVENYLRRTFRNLHVHVLELCEGERLFSPELQDSIVSLGEQLSSRLLAEVLDEHCHPAVHLDARKLILTDDAFTAAVPSYWETYARIRWGMPPALRDKLIVVGGFIGSTADGRTTTLGRGGSDLTASIVGAALNADEIQVWKDVDGMLTCDPRWLSGGHQVRRLSYEEATALASSGATILHPETMEPARRLRIPLVIRNTFHPENEGTRIEHLAGMTGGNVVKSIAIRKHVALLEVAPATAEDSCDAVIDFCLKPGTAASVLCSSGVTFYIAIDENAHPPEEQLLTGPCVEARVRTGQCLVTLVGDFADEPAAARVASDALRGIDAMLLPPDLSGCSLRFALPQVDLAHSIDALHRAFFAKPDPQFFAAASPAKPAPAQETTKQKVKLRSYVPTLTLASVN